MSEKTDSVISIIFSIIILPVMMFITVAGFLKTGYSVDLLEIVLYRNDNPLLNILGLVLFAGLVFAFSILMGKMSKRLQIITVSLIITIFAVLWITFTGTKPEADQNYIVICAEEINEGNYSSLGVGGYLAVYRQQLGMVTVLRGIYKLFGANNYVPFRYIVAALLPLLVISGEYVTDVLSDGSEKAGRYYMLILMTFFPFFFYTDFVYGDVISVIFIMTAIACVLKSVKSLNPVYMVLMFLMFFLAVWTRENSLIIIIASIIAVIFTHEISAKRKVLLIVLMLAAAFLPGQVNNLIYGRYIPADADSMPIIMHITMGMQMNPYSETANAGWYNGYNYYTFKEYGWDADAVSQAAHADAKTLIGNFISNPQYALTFYRDKTESQWISPMMSALELNRQYREDASKIIRSIYTGKIYTILLEFMNIWQLFVYVNALIFEIDSFKKKNVLHNILLIGILGGFMFSILWEAKTRYILIYVILMIPCAAGSFAMAEKFLREKIFNRFKHRKTKKRL